ncbi:hypothetical protein, partial [Enterococcus faecalis]|uniref:hypothetical protein n=1 Tax=Enterococcus faecalis TaxID=1351 RepID=UPI001F00B993
IPPAIFFYYSTLFDSRFKTLQQNQVEDQFEKAKDLRNAVFPQEEELAEKIALQAQLNAEIEQSLAKDSKQTEQKPVIEATEGVEFSV